MSIETELAQAQSTIADLKTVVNVLSDVVDDLARELHYRKGHAETYERCIDNACRGARRALATAP